MCSLFRSKLEKEVESERLELQNILEKIGKPSIKDSDIVEELKKLASRVGASTLDPKGYDIATKPQSAQNIHQALQTKSMIAAVKTASNQVIVSIILALIAFGSMITAIIAVCSKP